MKDRADLVACHGNDLVVVGFPDSSLFKDLASFGNESLSQAIDVGHWVQHCTARELQTLLETTHIGTSAQIHLSKHTSPKCEC